MKVIDGLPDFLDCDGSLAVRVRGRSAVVRCDRFVARFSLSTGKVDWVVERTPVRFADSTWRLPRYIHLIGLDAPVLWFGEGVVAELVSTSCGAMRILAREASTGTQLWEHFIAIPDAAEWAEAVPAWAGAQTEQIDGVIANDPSRLAAAAEDDGWVELFNGRNLEGSRKETGEWKTVGKVLLDPADNGRFKIEPGSGVLVNGRQGKAPNGKPQ